MQHRPKVTRRRLLKITGSALAVAPFIHLQSALAQTPEPPLIDPEVAAEPDELALQPTKRPFGRVFQDHFIVREQPSTKATAVRTLSANEVIPLQGQVSGDGPTLYNPTWYQTTDGFVHSASVQPCENNLNKPLTAVESPGLWGDVTVPFTELRAAADPKAGLRGRLYFGCVFRIQSVSEGTDGQPWYRIADGNGGNASIGYVRAEQLRPLSAKDFAPLAPGVPLENKRIEVNLKAQTATAFENDKPVFSARVATGGVYRTPQGVVNFFTPSGEHRIFRKIAGTRMVGGTPGYDYYNLPGVSWATFFTTSGVAFHGTYWHNDYGKPRSHGCVNMLPEDAQWVFRWTLPVYAATEQTNMRTSRDQGTFVKVF